MTGPLLMLLLPSEVEVPRLSVAPGVLRQSRAARAARALARRPFFRPPSSSIIERRTLIFSLRVSNQPALRALIRLLSRPPSSHVASLCSSAASVVRWRT